MLELMKSNITMSSREIAELTGKRHDNVMRDIRKMLTDIHGEAGVLKFEDTYMNYQNGQPYPIFNLPKDETLCLLTGYDSGSRFKVVKRWRELEESQPKLPDFTNPAEAARAWANEFEQKKIAQEALAIAAPKVDFYDAVTGSDDCIEMAEVAKVLNIPGMGRNKIFALLRDQKVLRKRPVNQPYQKHVDAGHFRLIETSWTDGNGDTHVRTKTVVLQKGVDYIRKLVERKAKQ